MSYVLENTKEEVRLENRADNNYDILKPKGRLCVIDADGIFFYVDTDNEKSRQTLNLLQNQFTFDSYIARKIPALSKKEGFDKILWRYGVMMIQNESRKKKIANYEDRLEFGRSLLVGIPGQTEADGFIGAHLDNKFAVQGVKA